ncbi:neurotactin isoform X2 [Periplaneta americana]|uniref:neurotactin isoform X2 n=1 Tax=Periplaneta americana TaxID=6978 RepID=UPI0037E9C7CE
MSTTLANPTEEKSEDKKEIEDEEREKMLNEENKRTGAAEEGEEVVIKPVRREGEGEVEKMRKALEESEKESVKKKIPIGGIKMPGFLRSRSREKTKEGELDVEEGKDLLQEPPCIATNATPSDAGTDKEQTPPSKGPRLPSLKLANPFSKKKDPELGQQAGLASMETLDDSMGEKTEKMTNGDDGMESVKLDTEEKMDPDKKEELDEKEDWRERVRALSKFKLIVGGSVIILILLIIIVAIAPFGSHHYTAPIPVEEEHFKEALTACGPVEGLVEDGAFAFRGIPYAVQPMGKRRWKPAEPLNKLESCWDGVLPVHNSTAPCWQIYPSGKIDGAEDCLTLDIFTPQVGYMNPLPVVVLVGAESLSGGSPGALRPSALLARDKDVVFVRPNFRLGVLGFLAAEILKNDSYPPTSGNYGLSDLVVVLRWINLNIEHFGGDKNAVTLLGHRAGGTLVTALTASRETKGLFLNAWVSSGAGIFPGIELIESERVSAEFVETLQCGNDLECLRKKDTEELLDSVPELWRHPLQDLPRTDDESSSLKHQWLVLDGKYLQKHVTDAWKTNGLHANLVMGSTVHADVPPKLYDNWTGEQVENHVKSSVVGSKNLTSEALHRYGADWPGLIAMISDIRTVCPLLYLSLSYKEKIIPFYLVNHTRISSHSQSSEPLADVSVDVEAILGQYEGETHSQKKYVESMQELFYHFVRHGSLKNEKSLGVNQGLLINENVIPIRSFSNCEFWFAKDIAPRHGRID